MVAQADAVVAHRVDQADLQVPVQDGEIGRTLAEIAGVQQKDVAGAPPGADAVHVGRTLDDAAGPVPHGVQMAVGVVGVEDDEPAPGSRAGGQAKGGCTDAVEKTDLSHGYSSSFFSVSITTTRSSSLPSMAVLSRVRRWT